MKQHRSIRTALRIALAAGLSAALGAPAIAFAQGGSPSPAKLGKVEVTGTRIKRTSIVTPEPITRVTHQQIEESGFKNISTILERLTTIGTGNIASSSGPNSSSNVNLFYLGSDRTLVLLNGKRLIPGFGNTVDLRQIPVSIVDHIEVLQSGASAVYGSDAIAGVINIITKKNFNGAEASAYYGIANGPETGYWDGQTQHYDFALGHTSDRGHFLFDASYRAENGIPARDRDSTNENPRLGVTRGSLATPQGRFEFYAPGSGSGLSEPNPPAAYTGLTSQQCPDEQVSQGGQIYYIPHCALTIKKGTSGTHPSDYRPFTDQDRYLGPMNAVTDTNIKSIYGEGSYDLAPWLTVNLSTLYNRRQFRSHGGYAGVDLDETGLTIGADNPYNPFGFTLSNSQPVGVAPGVTLPALQAIERANLEYGPESSFSDDTTFRFDGGFSGQFNAGERDWDWNADYIYMTNKTKGSTTNHLNNLTTSLATSPTCSDIEGCVPLNPFGGQGINGAGSLTPAMVNYTATHGADTGHSEKDVRILDFNISSSDIFDLPGGPVGFAAGYEHRNVSGRSVPSTLAQIVSRRNPQASSILDGGYSLNAYYGELNIPIYSNFPGINYLGVDAATRYSDYSTFGGTVNSRVGVKYQPVSDVVLRGTYAEGFRSPTIGNLYAARHRIQDSAVDPCSNYTAPGTPAETVKNCKAGGVPASYVQKELGYPIYPSGNPNLDPETSVSKTAGAIYSPSQVPGLSVDFGYFHIKLSDVVTAVYTGNMLNFCYKYSVEKFCSYIHRKASGKIDHIDAPIFNIGAREIAGYNLGFNYKIPSTPFGDFTVSAHATHANVWEDIFPLYNGTSSVHSIVGSLNLGSAVPVWKANARLNYDYGRFSAAIIGHFISDFTGQCSDFQDNTDVSLANLGFCTHVNAKNNALSTLHRGAIAWYDVHVSYALPWNVNVSAGVNNIFGKEPAGGDTSGGYSEYLGALDYGVYSRYLYGQISVKF
jgi:iron complex outermembrane receptor protein